MLQNSKNKAAANAFALFLKSVPAQQIFAQYGYRPVNPKVTTHFPKPSGLVTIDAKYIGGWRNADKVWFNPKNGRMVKIEQQDGGPTSG